MKWRVNGTRRFGSFHGFPQNIGSPGALTIWMEKPGILGRIQMERFIPVKDLPSVVMTIFLLLPNWPGNFCTINLSTTTSARLFPRKQHAKRKMAAWNIDSWLFQTVYSCDRCCFRFSSPLQSRSLFSASFQTFCLIEYAKIRTVLQSRGQGGKFPNFFWYVVTRSFQRFTCYFKSKSHSNVLNQWYWSCQRWSKGLTWKNAPRFGLQVLFLFPHLPSLSTLSMFRLLFDLLSSRPGTGSSSRP